MWSKIITIEIFVTFGAIVGGKLLPSPSAHTHLSVGKARSCSARTTASKRSHMVGGDDDGDDDDDDDETTGNSAAPDAVWSASRPYDNSDDKADASSPCSAESGIFASATFAVYCRCGVRRR